MSSPDQYFCCLTNFAEELSVTFLYFPWTGFTVPDYDFPFPYLPPSLHPSLHLFSPRPLLQFFPFLFSSRNWNLSNFSLSLSLSLSLPLILFIFSFQWYSCRLIIFARKFSFIFVSSLRPPLPEPGASTWFQAHTIQPPPPGKKESDFRSTFSWMLVEDCFFPYFLLIPTNLIALMIPKLNTAPVNKTNTISVYCPTWCRLLNTKAPKRLWTQPLLAAVLLYAISLSAYRQPRPKEHIKTSTFITV